MTLSWGKTPVLLVTTPLVLISWFRWSCLMKNGKCINAPQQNLIRTMHCTSVTFLFICMYTYNRINMHTVTFPELLDRYSSHHCLTWWSVTLMISIPQSMVTLLFWHEFLLLCSHILDTYSKPLLWQPEKNTIYKSPLLVNHIIHSSLKSNPLHLMPVITPNMNSAISSMFISAQTRTKQTYNKTKLIVTGLIYSPTSSILKHSSSWTPGRQVATLIMFHMNTCCRF